MFPVVDGHADIFSKCIEDGLDYLADAARFQASIANLNRGGVRVQCASVYVPKRFSGDEATHYALRIVGVGHRVARLTSGATSLVNSRRSLDRVCNSDTPSMGFVFSMEGASPLAGDASRLDVFARLGVRILGLTHNHDNECGDGCFSKEPKGLTEVGRDIARAAEARGILLDAAHLNARSFDHVMGLRTRPVVYSHGGSRALVDSPRNLTDAQARAVAQSGGVLGVDFFPGHIARDGKAGTLSDVADHVEHWVALVGADFVGFGGDMDGIPTTLTGVEDAGAYPAILAELERRGMKAADLAKIAGENWMRVLGDVMSDGLGTPEAGDSLSAQP